MRILLLDLGRELRGGQRQVWYLARQLAREPGMEPVAACPAGSPLLEELQALGIETYALPSDREWDVRSLLRLHGIHRRHSLDIIHTHCARSASLGALCRMLLPRPPRLVHTRRVSYPLGRGWSRRKYLAADAVAAVSDAIRQQLLCGGVPPDRITVIHSGLDPDRYPHAPQDAGEPFILGAIGAFTAQKGYSVLVKALAALQEMPGLPRWEARLVGNGPLLASTLALAQAEGVAERIAFLGYQDSRDVLPGMSLLAVASVHGEGSSGVIKEAWAVGVPVICSDLPSNLELVAPGATGLAVPAGDPRALAGGLARLMTDASLRAALVAGGATRLKEFTDQAMTAAYMRLYAALAQSPE